MGDIADELTDDALLHKTDEGVAVTVYYCPTCLGIRQWCRKCKTPHCDCLWNKCQLKDHSKLVP